MLPSDPYEGHNSAVVTAIMLAGAPALIGLVAYTTASLARFRRVKPTPAAVLRACSLLLVTAAFAVYLWGCSHLFLLEDEDRARACLEVLGRENARRVDRYIADFVPLRFACHLPDGRSYNALVPEYINPSIAVLLSLALACGIMSVLLNRKRQHAATRKEG